MDFLKDADISCPYCGEHINVLIEPQDAEQEYIEDCQVCCKPIVFSVTHAHNGELCLSVRSENDSY